MKDLQITQLVNQLMESNCYIVVDPKTKTCIIIDSGSEKAAREIEYIKKNGLIVDYIIMTHEHADHSWGVNTLKGHFPEAKLIYSEASNQYMRKSIMLFFRMWHEDNNYEYMPVPADVEIREDCAIDWNGHLIRFVLTSGHSLGSMCINIDDCLFTGDTIMPFPPYFNGKGSNKDAWAGSVKMICEKFPPDTDIYPGHGEVIKLGDWKESKFSKINLR